MEPSLRNVNLIDVLSYQTCQLDASACFQADKGGDDLDVCPESRTPVPTSVLHLEGLPTPERISSLLSSLSVSPTPFPFPVPLPN